MDVLLVNAPVARRSKHARLTPPLGLAYIAAALLAHGYSVSVEDFNITGLNAERLRGILEKRSPRILGISVSTETYNSGLKIAGIAKEVDPAITVVMGGPHATVMYRQAASQPDVDVVVRGEGEYTMLELADRLLRSHAGMAGIRGIACRQDGKVRVTADRPFIGDPDELPFPARQMFPMPFYEHPGQVLMSRGGCPFNCCFCAVNNIWQGTRRYRQPEKVLDEVGRIAEQFQLQQINFADDTFTLNRANVLHLCDIADTLKDKFPWRWKCTTRVDLVDGELLGRMREAGCNGIAFGVESGSQEILDNIGKRITPAQISRAVTAALDSGMEVLCSFMFPHPWDTEPTIREQKRFMKELLALGATVSLALTTPLPGTVYYEQADRLGLRLLTDNWDEFDAKHLIIATRNLPEERLQSLLEELLRDVGLKSQFSN